VSTSTPWLFVKVADLVAGCRAAERLLRSGAFGLVVVDAAGDVSSGNPASDAVVPMGNLGSLHGLAQAHDAAVVVLTMKKAQAPSMRSIVSLRVEAAREGGGGMPFGNKVSALKDKRRGPWCLPLTELRPPPGVKP
jgi:recombination protein RecA